MRSIITCRSLELGDNYDDIVDTIKNDSRYEGLRKICQYYPAEKRLAYLTEAIHPDRCRHPHRIPILFLFSNPHPDSVCRGLFLSEPHSRSFWQRLIDDSDYFDMSRGQSIDLAVWNESTPQELGQLMLEGKYVSLFLLYFHCLWPLPTNQVADLKALFKSKPEHESIFTEQVDKAGWQELAKLIQDKQIKHIVVFTGSIFDLVTEANGASHRGWRSTVKCAVDRFLEDGDTVEYRASLSQGRSKALFSSDVSVYLGLDTRSKNMGKGMPKRYFTYLLDMILAMILDQLLHALPSKNQSG